MTKTVTVGQPLCCDLCGTEVRALTDCPVKIGGRTTWAHACDRCFADCGVETSVNTRLVFTPAGEAVTCEGRGPTLTVGQLAEVLAGLPAEAPVLASAGGWWMNVKAAQHMDEASPPYLDLAVADDFDTRQW